MSLIDKIKEDIKAKSHAEKLTNEIRKILSNILDSVQTEVKDKFNNYHFEEDYQEYTVYITIKENHSRILFTKGNVMITFLEHTMRENEIINEIFEIKKNDPQQIKTLLALLRVI